MAKDINLRLTLVLYIVVFALLALVLSLLTANFCQQAQARIWAAYPPVGEKYYLVSVDGKRLGAGEYIGVEPAPVSAQDERWLAALDFVQRACMPVYSAACIIAAALLFYHRRLKAPLGELRRVAEKIAANDLDFRVEYTCRDELGQLCTAFETMRLRLACNFAEMWEQVEARRQLNAAFAHDLRTPLTVLKGYNELLEASAADAETVEIVATMNRQIVRLEAYVAGMSSLQRLEQQEAERKPAAVRPLLAALREGAEIICRRQGRELLFTEDLTCDSDYKVWLDTEFVNRVSNNLLDNAARYAQRQICFTAAVQADGLLLTVSDDGRGFAPEALAQAANPYFSGEANRAEHFGLGLYICKLLCQRHGGYLHLANQSAGGAVVQAYFSFAAQ